MSSPTDDNMYVHINGIVIATSDGPDTNYIFIRIDPVSYKECSKM